LEKLRAALQRRGIAATATLAAVISANAVQIAPANLAAALTATSVAAVGTGTFTILKIMTATQLKLGIASIIVAGAAAVLMTQHQTHAKLTVQNELLAQQLANLRNENEAISNRLTSLSIPQGKDTSATPPDELLKLRGENAVLQRQLNDANQKTSLAEQKLATELSAQAQFAKHETATINALKEIGLAARIYQNNGDQTYPTNFDQLTNSLGNSYKIGSISVYNFEFRNTGLLRTDYPHMVEFREQLPQQALDGRWRRVYGFADGSVQIAISNDGDFDAWEKVNTVSPPPSQTPPPGN
jgi:hypothetical protein